MILWQFYLIQNALSKIQCCVPKYEFEEKSVIKTIRYHAAITPLDLEKWKETNYCMHVFESLDSNHDVYRKIVINYIFLYISYYYEIDYINRILK